MQQGWRQTLLPMTCQGLGAPYVLPYSAYPDHMGETPMALDQGNAPGGANIW